jgi:voltage-gated potassium channel Kch
MGITLGHVGTSSLSLITLVGLVTIAASTYLILFSHPIYDRIAPWLSIFERKVPFRELEVDSGPDGTSRPDLIVFGLGRYGARLMQKLHSAGVSVLGVDFDPEAVRELAGRGLTVRFGDGEDPALLESLPLADVPWVITTLPAWESNRALLHALRHAGYDGDVAAVVRDAAHGEAMDAAGVARVLNPFIDAADHAAEQFATVLLNRKKPTLAEASP